MIWSHVELRQMLEADRAWLKSSLQHRECGSSAPEHGAGGTESLQGTSNRMDLISTLVDIENALHKFEQGKYGICERCGKSLDRVLLEAKPEVRLCIECQALAKAD